MTCHDTIFILYHFKLELFSISIHNQLQLTTYALISSCKSGRSLTFSIFILCAFAGRPESPRLHVDSSNTTLK